MKTIITIENIMIYFNTKQSTQQIIMPTQANTVNSINSSVGIVDGITSAIFYAPLLYLVKLTVSEAF